MCVAVKRKLQLYYWKNNEFLSYADDISISDFPKSIVWCKQSICVGLRNEYILVKVLILWGIQICYLIIY